MSVRQCLLVASLTGLLAACDRSNMEIVYLGPAVDDQVSSGNDWGQFEKVLSARAAALGLEEKFIPAYTKKGCREWSRTRRGIFVYDLEACPQAACKGARGAPSGIVLTNPRPWNPLEVVEADAWRAGLYEDLRREFGARVRVVPFDPAIEF